MTVGKLSVIAWVVFCVMSVAFMPMILFVHSIHGLPHPVAIGLDVFIVLGLWWGSFGYGMYSVQAGMGGGDSRLFKKGVRGTAVVLEKQATNTTIGGQPDMGIMGRRVYRYRVRVTLPGKEPYETVVRVATSAVEEGRTVSVAAARHNHKRVAIEFHRSDRGRPTAPVYTDDRGRASARNRVSGKGSRPAVPHPTGPRDAVPLEFRGRPAARSDVRQGEGERLRLLAEAGRLHKEGVLTDEEFAAEKARILGNR